MTRYTVSTHNYETACAIVAALESQGIGASITEGGVGVHARDAGQLPTEQQIAAGHGERVDQGETFAAQFHEVLRQEMKGRRK